MNIRLRIGAVDDTYNQNDRILAIPTCLEQRYSATAKIVLNNSDNTLTTKAYEGARADIAFGYVDANGTSRSSLVQPMIVTNQYLRSAQGSLVVSLLMKGVFDLMDDDLASDDFEQDSGSTYTIKGLAEAICNATLPVYDHCINYVTTFDSDDAIFDTFKPADSFAIAFGESRRSSLIRLLEFTKTTARVESGDSKIHFFQPTVSGGTYDYVYKLADDNEHTFFTKVTRTRFLIPNYIEVSSHPEDGDGYTGSAEDTSYSDLTLTTPFGSGEIREQHRRRLTSDAQAASLAAARLEKVQQAADKGSATVPIQVNQEIDDYVNFVDARESDNERAGNVGFINRMYDFLDAFMRSPLAFIMNMLRLVFLTFFEFTIGYALAGPKYKLPPWPSWDAMESQPGPGPKPPAGSGLIGSPLA
ncbi:hypothetical protein LCGC14_2457770, partial [marine sediment metagenome]